MYEISNFLHISILGSDPVILGEASNHAESFRKTKRHLIVIPFLARTSSISSNYPEESRGSEASDMDDFDKSLCGWSWEENKLFELALALVDEQHPERWEEVASMVGGQKSAGDVHQHYVILLEEIHVIESGKLDHKLGEVMPVVLVECKESIGLSDNYTAIETWLRILAWHTAVRKLKIWKMNCPVHML
ncbi:hypothetical protein VNO77_18168 [Canavalia gladiata]|uniref:Myb-like domain-containing protein n=1 Tax=Canavalia gladiata TaxID=3824 RepID=A0AAN9LL13_CANGL